MASPVLKLRYSISGKSLSSPETIELAVRYVYWMPEPLGEYYGSVRFDIEVHSNGPGKVSASEGRLVEKGPGIYSLSLTISQDHTGMVGTRRVPLIIRVDQVTYPLEIVMPIHPQGLAIEQFNAMLDDIQHWVFFALSSPVTKDIGYTNRFDSALHSNLAVLEMISAQIEEIEEAILQIAETPRSRIHKLYFTTHAPHSRQDPTTLRWSARHPGDYRALTSKNVTSHNIYENQFLAFFLEQVKRRLVFFEAAATRTIREQEVEIRKQNGWKNVAEVNRLERQKQKAGELRDRSTVLRTRLHRLRQLEFLREVDFVSGQFQLTYSLALTQDFSYGRIFALYLKLGRDEEIKRLDRAVEFVDRLASLGVEATSKIYEYWTFVAVLNELMALNFVPEGGDDFLQMIASDMLVPRLESGKWVTLVGDNRLYGDMKLRLYYDRSYGQSSQMQSARPDITLEVYRGKQLFARFLFDAKYKNYRNPYGQNSRDTGFWQGDFAQVASKYQAAPRGVIPHSQGAFLFHTNTSDSWFENYGAVVQAEEEGPWVFNAHRYGFIPVVPGALTQLRTLLAMIFLVKLDVGFDLCWVCGSTEIEQLTYRSQDGIERPNQRRCRRCGNRWWRNNCFTHLCPFQFFRGEFHFHVQHKSIDSTSNCDGIVCPGCGKCACKKQVVTAR